MLDMGVFWAFVPVYNVLLLVIYRVIIHNVYILYMKLNDCRTNDCSTNDCTIFELSIMLTFLLGLCYIDPRQYYLYAMIHNYINFDVSIDACCLQTSVIENKS